MSMYAMWIHGHAVVAQAPAVTPKPVRLGWGVTYDFGRYDKTRFQEWLHRRLDPRPWFHVAIPTPTVADNERAHLRRVMVLFNCENAPDWKRDPRNQYANSPSLLGVHIWDGKHLIRRFDDLYAAGDYTDKLAELYGNLGGNVFNMDGQEIQWGLGVSIQFKAARGGKLHFASVGADFDY
jgi:hypothetical protein